MLYAATADPLGPAAAARTEFIVLQGAYCILNGIKQLCQYLYLN